MKVFGLSGKSGTGKSYQAMNVCKDRDIESIIDDGLFIYKNQVVAGKSAKREATKVGAIKTALFTNDAIRDGVASAIAEKSPNSILIIGTSDAMVRRIAERLGLAEPNPIIHIEDITSSQDREIAKQQRMEQGKHVVPVPSMQLKTQFSGYFMHPMLMFKGWNFGKESYSEKSVVRPAYSYLGNFYISDKVINDIVRHEASQTQGIVEVNRCISLNKMDGLSVVIPVFMSYDCNVYDVALQLQIKVSQMIEQMTAFYIKTIDVEIRGLK